MSWLQLMVDNTIREIRYERIRYLFFPVKVLGTVLSSAYLKWLFYAFYE